jgi:hypothetical protein
MALTFTTLINDRQEPDQTSYTTPTAISPAADSWVLVAVTSQVASGTANQPTLTGGGIATWDVYSTHVRGQSRSTLFYGLAGGAPGSAQLVADFAGQTQKVSIIQAEQVAGALNTGTNGVNGFVQGVTGQTGANAATFSLTLSALASADNRAFGVYAVGANRTLSATAPATTLSTQAGTSSSITLTGADVAPEAQFTGTNTGWYGLLVEVAAAPTAPPTFTAYPRAAATALNGGVN